MRKKEKTNPDVKGKISELEDKITKAEEKARIESERRAWNSVADDRKTMGQRKKK